MNSLDVNQQGFIADALVCPRPAGLGAVFGAPVFKEATGADPHLAGQRDGP